MLRLAAVLALLALLPSVAVAPGAHADHEGDVSLSTDRRVYDRHETIRFTIRNDGDKPITFSGGGWEIHDDLGHLTYHPGMIPGTNFQLRPGRMWVQEWQAETCEGFEHAAEHGAERFADALVGLRSPGAYVLSSVYWEGAGSTGPVRSLELPIDIVDAPPPTDRVPTESTFLAGTC